MKQINRFSILLLAGLVFVFSCAKEQADNRKELASGNESEEVQAPAGKTVTISALLADAMTKVDFDPAYADGKTTSLALTWNENDKLIVADHANPASSAEFALVSGAGEKKAVFAGTAPAGATSYDVSVKHGDVTFASQTQPADADASGLQYMASKSGITDLSTIVFDNVNSVLAITAKMPSTEVADSIARVRIIASEAIFNGRDSLTIRLDNLGDAGEDGILHLFATLPQGDQAIAAGTTLLIHFDAPQAKHTVYTRFVELPATTFTAGKLNTINVNASQSDKHAGLPTCDGTTADKAYLIGDKYQLLAVNGLMVAGATKYFKLLADLDMTGEEWAMLNNPGPYDKLIDFDGNNKTISHLGKSMFYVFKGTIKNLTFDNITINSGSQRGILGQYIQGTGNVITNVDITNSSVTGGNNTGALIGRINTGSAGVATATISDCDIENTSVNGKVTGGLVGSVEAEVVIENCTVAKKDSGTYTIKGTVDNVGGLIGSLTAGSSIADCSVSGIKVSVDTSGHVGGLIGLINAASSVTDCTVSGCDISARSVVGGVIGFADAVTTMSGCVYSGGTVTAKGRYCGGMLGSTGDHSSVISGCHVTNATITSSSDRVGGFVGQIGRNGVTVKGCTVGTPDTKVTVSSTLSSKNVNMGGFVGVCYGKVTKDGSNRSKAYVSITSGNTSTGTYVNIGGFVGFLEKGTIEYSDADATLSGIKGNQVGGFAGVLTNGGTSTVDNCTANATVSGNNYVAGFIGQAAAADHVITNNSSAGTVSGAATVAGFIGQASQGTLTKNSTSCTVTASGANSGGFAGQLTGNVTVSKCYTTGIVTGNGNVCGGFTGVASNGASISDCYSTGNLSGGTRKRGGIVGHVTEGTVSINRCYTTSNISNNFEMGGLVGFVSVETFTMTKCAAWNGSIVASSRSDANWSSAACVGVAYLTCTLTDNYRNPNMDSLMYWGTNSDCTISLPTTFQHPDVSPSAPLTDPQGNAVTSNTMRPYQGKCDAGKTLSQLASTTLGWSSDVWDFSGELPTLK